MYGPPGSGKGTQAKLLAEGLGFFHLDSGDFLRKLIYDPKNKKNKIIQREKKLNEAGKLQTPSFVLDVIGKRIQELIALRQNIVFSGSPRTFYEAFGYSADQRGFTPLDAKISNGASADLRGRRGLVDILNVNYGRKNIFIFILDIPGKETYKRNSERLTCSICKTALLGQSFQKKGCSFLSCPICGGKITHRIDDNSQIIKTQLKEYHKRTSPIFKELKKRGYNLHTIDGTPAPYKIHEKICSALGRRT